MSQLERKIMSGSEAAALAAMHGGVAVGTGYPGMPCTEILECFSGLGGNAHWAPNEKVALEVGIGAALGGARTLVTMKHVGVNVAADPLFTSAYTGVGGGLVLIVTDDPGMSFSQNEQDTRNFARAASIPMLEPSDAQEVYDFTLKGFGISEQWKLPVIVRLTARICQSKTDVEAGHDACAQATPHFERGISNRVLTPSNARTVHRGLRKKIEEVRAWNEISDLTVVKEGSTRLGIITSGASFIHTCEAAPDVCILKIGMTHPMPIDRIIAFAQSVDDCMVIEEGDPYLLWAIRSTGVEVYGKPEQYRFGELDASRVRKILASDTSEDSIPDVPIQTSKECSCNIIFSVLAERDCIVSGDIGRYPAGPTPPFEAMDSVMCRGASIGVGLGLRHALPEPEARRVVSVIDDSAFVHSGLTGIVEMVSNRPSTGHVVCILDSSTGAATKERGHLEPVHGIDFPKVLKALGIEQIHVLEGSEDFARFEGILTASLAQNELTVIIARCASVS